MKKHPKYAEISGKRYLINTSYLIAIECQEIALNEEIGDYERALAIIYKLFGEDGLNDKENHVELLNIAKKFLCCGQEIEENNDDFDMDFIEDFDYIKTSFFSDYKIDLDKTDMHWHQFYNLLNGLSNSEFGNCCILNRIRNIRTMDTSDIKDKKRLEEIKKAKKQFELKRNKKKKIYTKQQLESMDKFYSRLEGGE